MRLPRRLHAALVLLFGLTSPALAQKSADTLRVTWRDAVPNVDPYYNTQRNGIILADLAWDGLLYRDPATGWRQVDDLTLEFTLREGVTFHNGDPFSAADVVYTLNSVPTDKRVASPSNYAFLAGAEALDPNRVRVTLKRPFPPPSTSSPPSCRFGPPPTANASAPTPMQKPPSAPAPTASCPSPALAKSPSNVSTPTTP